LKTALTVFMVLLLCAFAGCQSAVRGKKMAAADKELLTVDFQQGRTLRYKFVSSRNITLDWRSAGSAARSGKNGLDKSSETMEMVVAYTPIEIDPYGLTTIEATCESVKIKRSSSRSRRAANKDAAQSLAGKSFTFTVGPTGKIEDYSELEKLIRQAGNKAFRTDSRAGRVKEPDMIDDIINTQWFLWDSVSSIEKPVEGVSVGQTWKSKLLVPTPMVLREARDVTYKLDEIRPSNKGRLAVIRSSYQSANSAPSSWPIPYSGSFQLAGTFGFLRKFIRGFKVLDLQGQGKELFNIDAGRTEQYNQQYQIKLVSSSPSPLPGLNPRITIKQKITMKILE